MKTTKTIKASDLNEKLTDTNNTPKYFHVLLERHISGRDPKLGEIDNVAKGEILEESYEPVRRAEYKVWVDTEQTESTRDPQARVTIPGDKVVVFKKVITTTYTQV